MKRFFVFCMIVMFFCPALVSAQQLVFDPVNTSVGGHYNPMLLQMATIQDPHGFLKAEARAVTKQDLLDKFEERLTERALNELSREIVNRIFGEEGPATDESYSIGDYEIEITTTENGVKTTITDIVTGNTTMVEVPYY